MEKEKMVRCERCGRFFLTTGRFQTLKFYDKEFFACPYCVKEKEILKLEGNLEPGSTKIDLSEEYVGVINFAGLNVDLPSISDYYIYNLYFTPSGIIGIYLDKAASSHLSLSALDNLGLKKQLDEKDKDLMKVGKVIGGLFSSDERNFDIPYASISEIGIKRVWFKIYLKEPHRMDLIGEAPEFRFWAYSDQDKLIELAKRFCKIKLE